MVVFFQHAANFSAQAFCQGKRITFGGIKAIAGYHQSVVCGRYGEFNSRVKFDKGGQVFSGYLLAGSYGNGAGTAIMIRVYVVHGKRKRRRDECFSFCFLLGGVGAIHRYNAFIQADPDIIIAIFCCEPCDTQRNFIVV